MDGKRARANQRLEAGQAVRVPPLPDAGVAARPARERTDTADPALAAELADRVLYMDDEVLALNKPAGLAVQGGTGTTRHIDGALDGLRFGAAERPRLVHRLDKDTSGVMLLARSQAAARRLTAAFRSKAAMKIYWALVVGEPKPEAGTLDGAIAKLPGRAGEKMAVDNEAGKRAVTRYLTVEKLGRKACWMALYPVTGRTHQLRVHMAALGTPILGDGKYGGREAFLQGDGVSRKLHLHARAIRIPGRDGKPLEIVAPLRDHMARAWEFFDLEEAAAGDPFGPFEEPGA